MTGLALKHMLENSFSEAEGARPASRNIPRIGLVFTDGRSQDDVKKSAEKLQHSGLCGVVYHYLYVFCFEFAHYICTISHICHVS